jgi:hypothetical protein
MHELQWYPPGDFPEKWAECEAVFEDLPKEIWNYDGNGNNWRYIDEQGWADVMLHNGFDEKVVDVDEYLGRAVTYEPFWPRKPATTIMPIQSDGGAPEQLAALPGFIEFLDWDSDGSVIYYAMSDGKGSKRGPINVEIYQLQVETGVSQQLSDASLSGMESFAYDAATSTLLVNAARGSPPVTKEVLCFNLSTRAFLAAYPDAPGELRSFCGANGEMVLTIETTKDERTDAFAFDGAYRRLTRLNEWMLHACRGPDGSLYFMQYHGRKGNDLLRFDGTSTERLLG